MRFTASEKLEIIKLVEESDLPVKMTLEQLGIPRTTFYGWYRRYLDNGYDGLLGKGADRRGQWNRIPDQQRQEVVEIALDYPEKSPRELAFFIIDHHEWFISESSVYRILKAKGLITSPTHILIQAADRFKDPPARVHELWQTDFTYLKVIHWGWYYLTTILDDYSRYIVAWELCRKMCSEDAKRIVKKALDKTGIPLENRPRLLSDNGSCYISGDLKEYLDEEDIKHVRGKPNHPQTQGKIERYHRSMKNIIRLENYHSPEQLEGEIAVFVEYYNNRRYHESLNNLTPADVYFGRGEEIIRKREKIKQKTMIQRRIESKLLNAI